MYNIEKRDWQSKGRGFESLQLHFLVMSLTARFPIVCYLLLKQLSREALFQRLIIHSKLSTSPICNGASLISDLASTLSLNS